MNKLTLIPDSDGYSVNLGVGAIDSGVDGPAINVRKGLVNEAVLVELQWTVNEQEYEYLMSVQRYAETNGNPPFLIDLIIHSSELEEYEVKLSREGFRMVENDGGTFVVTAQVYARSVVGRPSTVSYPS